MSLVSSEVRIRLRTLYSASSPDTLRLTRFGCQPLRAVPCALRFLRAPSTPIRLSNELARSTPRPSLHGGCLRIKCQLDHAARVAGLRACWQRLRLDLHPFKACVVKGKADCSLAGVNDANAQPPILVLSRLTAHYKMLLFRRAIRTFPPYARVSLVLDSAHRLIAWPSGPRHAAPYNAQPIRIQQHYPRYWKVEKDAENFWVPKNL